MTDRRAHLSGIVTTLLILLLFTPGAVVGDMLGQGQLQGQAPGQGQQLPAQLQPLPLSPRDALQRRHREDAAASRRQDRAPQATAEEKRLRSGDTLLINILKPRDQTRDQTREQTRDEARDHSIDQTGLATLQRSREPAGAETRYISDKKIVVLDRVGGLVMPDGRRVILAGLNEREATRRLAAEPAYEDSVVSVVLLPVERELEPFGHELFNDPPSTFAPVMDIPIPIDYVVGPGDTVAVQLFGRVNAQHELPITRDGALQFPGIGPISVAGLTFTQLQEEIKTRVQSQLTGVTASVTMGRIRSIRIFVLGDAESPGSFEVSGLSTLTNALIASGGVNPGGSLRDVQLKRNNEIVSRMDLYELLLHGDTQADVRLLPGDVIFISPSGIQVGISGQVRRPAIYELKHETTIDELIALGGGLLHDAYPQRAQIERVRRNRERVLIDIDLTNPESGRTRVQDGDLVRIFPVLDQITDVVALTGHVSRPGDYQWFPGMRLTDLLPSMSVLRSGGDGRYLLIKREDPKIRTIELISADLLAALGDPGGDADLILQQQDRIHVFDIHSDRSPVIEPMLREAAARSAPDKPVSVVSIEGMVHHPGRYPLSPEMKITDLLRAAGGLNERAYMLDAELTRHTVVDGRNRKLSRQIVDPAAALEHDVRENIALAPYDQLTVRRIPGWDETGVIELAGEVKFPGKYPIARGEKLSQVIQRAGGITEDAYPRAAVFLREAAREREQQSIDQLAARLEQEMALIMTSREGMKPEEARMLLNQIRTAEALGRVVIDLGGVLRDRGGYDVAVNPGDFLYIPQQPEEVTVVGEVYNPTSHLYNKPLSRHDYISLSGGVTENGNKRAVYVIHADGSVSPTRRFGRNPEVDPAVRSSCR